MLCVYSVTDLQDLGDLHEVADLVVGYTWGWCPCFGRLVEEDGLQACFVSSGDIGSEVVAYHDGLFGVGTC